MSYVDIDDFEKMPLDELTVCTNRMIRNTKMMLVAVMITVTSMVCGLAVGVTFQHWSCWIGVLGSVVGYGWFQRLAGERWSKVREKVLREVAAKKAAKGAKR